MKPIHTTLCSFFFLCLFHVAALLGVGYDPTDPRAVAYLKEFHDLGTDSEGRSYSMALAPISVQSYVDFLNATCTGSDPHSLYSTLMQSLPAGYTQIPFTAITQNSAWGDPPSFTYSCSAEANMNVPMTYMNTLRAARCINWCNNRTTESGTYLISENPTNSVPPGGFSASYPSIKLDTNGIIQAIRCNQANHQADSSTPALTMFFLPTEPVLYAFNSSGANIVNDNFKITGTGDAFIPTGSDATNPSFSYLYELTSSLDPLGARTAYSFYGTYFLLQGTLVGSPGYSYPAEDSKYTFNRGFRLLKVTFPTDRFPTTMPSLLIDSSSQ